MLQKLSNNPQNQGLIHGAAQNAAHKKRNLEKIKASTLRITGLEPARVTPPEPKSGASANSAISANKKPLYFYSGRDSRWNDNRFIHVDSLYAFFIKSQLPKKAKSKFLFPLRLSHKSRPALRLFSRAKS